jgi:hypothetical protein
MSVKIEGQKIPAPVSNEVQVSGSASLEQKKFEWNTPLLYSNNPNHSKTRTVSVGLFSTILVLPALVSLIVDLGRRVAFAMGKCDGKSYSLVDKITPFATRAFNSVSKLTEKVSQSVKNLFKKKEITPEQALQIANDASKKEMKSLVKQIVQTYHDENNARDNAAPAARKAVEKRLELHDKLANEMGEYTIRNSSSDTLTADMRNLDREIEKMFDDAGKNSVFTTVRTMHDRVVNTGKIACREFLEGSKSFEPSLKNVDQRVRVEIAKKDFRNEAKADEKQAAQKLMQVLKGYVDSQGVELDQAKAAVREVAGDALVETFKKSFAASNDVAESHNKGLVQKGAILAEAKSKELITDEELVECGSGSFVDLDTLTDSAAVELARHLAEHPLDDKGASEKLAKIVRDLIEQRAFRSFDDANKFEAEVNKRTAKILAGSSKDLQAVLDRLSKSAPPSKKAEIEAAKKKAQLAEAKARMKAEMEAAQAKELEQANSAYDHYVGDLRKLLQKEKVVKDEKLPAYRTLEAERKQIVKEYQELINRKVIITGCDKPVLLSEAEKYYEREMLKIFNITNPATREAALKKFTSQEFVGDLEKLISERKDKDSDLQKNARVMSLKASEIGGLINEIVALSEKCKAFRNENSKLLGKVSKEQTAVMVGLKTKESEARKYIVQSFEREILGIKPRGFIAGDVEIDELAATEKEEVAPEVKAAASSAPEEEVEKTPPVEPKQEEPVKAPSKNWGQTLWGFVPRFPIFTQG